MALRAPRSSLSYALVALCAGCASMPTAGAPDGAPALDAAATDASASATDAGEPATEGAALDAAPRPGPRLFHQAATARLEPGAEVNNRCESFTLDNAETLYVNAVEFRATGGMHHSNWLFVPQSYFQGPDGTWDCDSRDFDQGLAAAVGGVLFAQSTQSTEETQRFAPGVAIPIPPRSRVIGQVHQLNATGAALETSYSLQLRTIARDDVRVRLRGLYLEYGPLRIPARAMSRSTTRCDLATTHRERLDRGLDFNLYYGLAHYHDLARAMRVRVVGGPRDGQLLYESRTSVGDPAGQTFAPPVSLTGATGLSLECEFNNPRDRAVGYGVGDQEMCIFLGFTDSPLQWAARAPHRERSTAGDTTGGVQEFTAPCSEVYALNGHGE